MKRIIIFFLLGLIMVNSCKKDDSDEDQPNGNGIKWTCYDGKLSYLAGSALQLTPDNNMVLAGTYNGKYLVLKVSQDGQEIWNKNIGTNQNDEAESIQVTNDNGYIIAGSSFTFTTSDIYIMKMNQQGDTVWTRKFGWGDINVCHCISKTQDDNYILCGHTQNFSKSDAFGDVYVIKFNNDGDTLWTKTYEDPGEETAYCIQPANDGGFVLTGRDETNNNKNMLLMKIDTDGKLLWKKSFGGSNWEEGFYLIENTQGEILACGMTQYYSSDVYLVKTTATGSKIWEKSYGSASKSEKGFCIQQATNGYVISGSQYTVENIDDDIYLLKINLGGSVDWAKVYGENKSEWGNAVRVLPDGKMIIAGTTMSISDGGNIFIIKTDVNGNIL